MACLILPTLAACTPGGPGTSEPGTTDDPDVTTTATGPTTGVDATDTATSTGDAPPTTGESTGSEPADGCKTPDPAVSAAFDLDLGDVPGAAEVEVDLELACTVTAVAVDKAIATDLDCLDSESAPHAVGFDVAATDVGAPVWAVDEAVTLRVVGVQQFGGVIESTSADMLTAIEVALHRDADGALLASATRSYKASADLYTPLQITADRDACGADLPMEDPDFPGPDRDMALGFKHGDGEVTLFTRQRGQIAVGADVLAIDVDAATAIECCHNDIWIDAITRLVKPG